jgi:signal transduction histidine kinase
MKFLLAIIALLTMIAISLNSQVRDLSEANVRLQNLYNQAIQWQNTYPVPLISKNIKLKSKEN